MTIASATRHVARVVFRDRDFPRRVSTETLPVCRNGTRQRAYATCHLAGCSTLKPRTAA